MTISDLIKILMANPAGSRFEIIHLPGGNIEFSFHKKEIKDGKIKSVGCDLFQITPELINESHQLAQDIFFLESIKAITNP